MLFVFQEYILHVDVPVISENARIEIPSKKLLITHINKLLVFFFMEIIKSCILIIYDQRSRMVRRKLKVDLQNPADVSMQLLKY